MVDEKRWITRTDVPYFPKLSEDDQSWLKAQLRRGLSYTILSATWQGPSKAELERRKAKRCKDERTVSRILPAIHPPKKAFPPGGGRSLGQCIRGHPPIFPRPYPGRSHSVLIDREPAASLEQAG
jgi:hypothetical protein